MDELIVRLRDAMHIGILIVTHDLDSVARIADRVTVLDEGRSVMVGTLDEIRHSPNERVQALLTRTPGVGIVDEDAYLRRLTGDRSQGADPLPGFRRPTPDCAPVRTGSQGGPTILWTRPTPGTPVHEPLPDAGDTRP
ncbi:MAG: hypothetical protein LJE91_07125 [Gammaproteobacteria bacterium]|nr:hypothetical protein [Gammaproteobacteria bacterium]